jgi:hypothetical protein
MKYLIALALSVFILAGCGKDSGNKPAALDGKNKYAFDSTDIKTSPASNPNESFQFVYKFEKGKKYNYRLTTIMKDDQALKADSLIKESTSQSMIYIFTLSGVSVDQDAMELECNVSSVKIDAKEGRQTLSYESGKADSATKVRFSNYEALINNPFSLRVSKSGEVLEIFRVDRIINKVLALNHLKDSVNAQQKAQIKQTISEGALKQLMMQVFREMPNKSMAKDSSWSKPQQPQKVLSYETNATNTYKVASLGMMGNDKLAIIDAGMVTTFTGQNKVSQGGINYDIRKPVTSADGKIYFNITTGMIQKSKTRTKIDFYMEIEANTPQGKKKGTRTEQTENISLLELL